MALPGLNMKKSGLEGLTKDELLTPYEILNNTKKELNWTENDTIFMSANYLQFNTKRWKESGVYGAFDHKYKGEVLDITKYFPINYNAEKFASHKLGLNYVSKARLDFQIMLSAVESEVLIRDFLLVSKDPSLNDYYKKIDHANLIFSFINNFSDLRRPNGKSFMGSLGKIELNGEIASGYSGYGNLLDKLYNKGEINIGFIIDNVLKNSYKNYFLTEEHNC